MLTHQAPQREIDTEYALDTDSSVWVRLLSGTGSEHDSAVRQLHELLLRVARHEIRRRGSQGRVTGPELDDLAQQAADDALVAIAGKLGQFRGESRFTTWAYKFAIFEVSTKLNRHFWRRPTVDVKIDEWESFPDRFGLDPANEYEWRELASAVRKVSERDLTALQLRVFTAIVLEGAPLDVLAQELDSNRNAIYKALFDARRKLRQALVADGFLQEGEG